MDSKEQKYDSHYKPTKKDLLQSKGMIIDDNENFVVINKPSGISVQSGSKSKRNIVDILRESKEFDNYKYQNISFLGGISDAQLLSEYKSSDLFILPSIDLEGFGLVVYTTAELKNDT